MANTITIFADLTTTDPKAMSQFHDAMSQPFAVKGAVMPDVHLGYSLPIGSVVATRGYIVPSWVGYDIGCGVLAVKISTPIETVDKFSSSIFDGLLSKVPTGNSKHSSQNASRISRLLVPPYEEVGKWQFEARDAINQLGTLGGGNHFIEIGYDASGGVWVIVHCGSRGVGHGIAGEYMKIASGSDKAKEGHYALDVTSKDGANYISDMNWAICYAALNRDLIANAVVKVIAEVTGVECLTMETINRNHNHAEFDGERWIHRKGATHAAKDMLGVIPGNMRDGSFIVRGLGNPDSLNSSSHGAGRVMGRGQAKRNLDMDEFAESMDGIVAKVSESTLDESPGAYKSIFDVMRSQKDLVEIVHYIRPLINLKG